jgi:glycosyltransferase involved in cell wall biosynthesis
MKILAVNATLDAITGGGTAERTLQLCRYLAKAGVDVSVLTLDIGLDHNRVKALAGVKLYALPCLAQRFYIPKSGIKEIAHLVQQADIIHIMGNWTLLNALVYYYVRKYHKKYIFVPAGAYKIIGRSTLLKVLYKTIIGQRILQHANAVIAITNQEAAELAQDYPQDKIVIIPNGIIPEDYQAQEPHFAEKQFGIKSPFILFLGRLNTVKGPDLLLEAFAQLQHSFANYQLVFAGPDDGMQQLLYQRARELKLNDRIHFIGHIAGPIKSKLMHEATLLVIPSRSEAMSIVVLEAGMVGVPVLATETCGVKPLVCAMGGEEVPATVTGIAQGLSQLLQLEDSVRLAMGKQLHAQVSKQYAWDSIVQNYLQLFENL